MVNNNYNPRKSLSTDNNLSYLLDFSWEVYAGTHDLSLSSEPHRQVVKTTESIIHPDWNPNTLANDLALIKLPKQIEFTDGEIC